MAELAAKAAGARALAKQIPVIRHTWGVLGTPGVLAQCEEICEKDCYQ